MKRSRLIQTIRKPDVLSGFRMVDHLKTGRFKNVRFSNESGFRMVGFRIPTVYHSSYNIYVVSDL